MTVTEEDVAATQMSFGIEVNPVNDAPTATNLNQHLNYDEGDGSVEVLDTVVSDVDPDETVTATLQLDDTSTGTLTATSGHGESYAPDTGIWSVGGSLADVNAALAAITFVPEVENETNTHVVVTIADGGEDGVDPLTGQITLEVGGVNDPPSWVKEPGDLEFDEDSTLAIGNLEVADPDSITIIASISVATVGTGRITDTDCAAAVQNWSVAGTVAEVNASLANITSCPPGNFDGVAELQLQVDDTANTANTTATLTARPSPDAPTITPSAPIVITFLEDPTPAEVGLDDVTVVDPDTGDVLDVELTLSDVNADTKSVAGNGVPPGRSIWYTFSATDDTDTNGDEFHVDVRFTTNPMGAYQIDVYRNGCPGTGVELATGETEVFDWYTDQNYTKVGCTQGKECGEGNCTTTTTVANKNKCSDNSATFQVRVSRTDGLASCDAYAIEFSNGVYKAK